MSDYKDFQEMLIRQRRDRLESLMPHAPHTSDDDDEPRDLIEKLCFDGCVAARG